LKHTALPVDEGNIKSFLHAKGMYALAGQQGEDFSVGTNVVSKQAPKALEQ
jgi:hypothetical protein